MSASTPDRINATFNWSVHDAFSVGSTAISADTCNSTVTYINDTRPVPVAGSAFQEVLIRDTNGFMIYMTQINDSVQGFNFNVTDFQMIVPENITGAINPYYFYVELS